MYADILDFGNVEIIGLFVLNYCSFGMDIKWINNISVLILIMKQSLRDEI